MAALSGRPGLRIWRIAKALCVTVFIFCLAVWLVVHAEWIYDIDLVHLGLDTRSGMTVTEIKENYLALIRYNHFWYRGPLVFPTLPMSEAGAIHFREVKRIFDVLQIAGLAVFVPSLLMIWRGLSKRDLGWLRLSGILTVLIPITLGIPAAINWERFFVTFHQVFFNNDYWLFDPATDPVITILPDTYFLHCAAGILLLLAAGSAICFCLSRSRKARNP